ncbi:putative Pseudaminic acid biosynthesis-associated protein PseG [Candidatus Terasakiella magnetica]|nr:putative Pseudaminic acid biosynthesis-associated protein PseG [Candidatus Terasakiella magnetica]
MILFRADASPGLGVGHVMRCLALAEALRRRGRDCRFACGSETLATVPALQDSGFPVTNLADDQGGDPQALMAAVAPPRWLVVDHYGLDEAYEQPLRSWAGRIAVIDDLADRNHACDLLLDQTAGRRAEDYAALVPPGARVLTGPFHGLLRPGFAQARPMALERRRRMETVESILVSLGGTDPANATSLALDALARADLKCRVVVVMGGAAPHLDEVRTRAARLDPPAEMRLDARDMPALLAAADLAIGASGGSAWERCCLGLPSLTVVSADNQREVARGLALAGAADVCGLDPAAMARALVRLAKDGTALRRMAEQAAALCDGDGAGRLAEMLLALESDDLALRRAVPEDGPDLLSWRNDPLTRTNSKDRGEVALAPHLAWLARVLADPARLLLLAEMPGGKAGMVRFDQTENGDWLVSIAVAPAFRGRGLGCRVLAAGIRDLAARKGAVTLVAEIAPANSASRVLFEACGFTACGAADGFLQYRAVVAEA